MACFCVNAKQGLVISSLTALIRLEFYLLVRGRFLSFVFSSPLECVPRIFSICVIDILSSKISNGRAKLKHSCILEFGGSPPPSIALFFIFQGGIQLGAET